ncbi:uncharacterized protein LOC105431548 [Pogonomyrmex barbatus]|uniref:Uncharacterized protein LOC105431548 n=1 Tax=Pogonomyrmex barbatus TaxID=144034 RepID=A0A6I9WMF9_9HYME|nr:uncharacterized protein LOC105431548 [Pogonomyrmex barbatus]
MKKFLVLIACLLAVVCADNPEAVKDFYDNSAKCTQELNKPQNDIDVLMCILRKHGLIDNDDKYLLDKGLAYLDELISDEAKRNQAKETIRKCYNDNVKYDGSQPNLEFTKKGIQCAQSVLALIDKP